MTESTNLDKILTDMMAADASDLHLKVGRPPIMRRWGELVDMPGYEVLNDNKAVSEVLNPILANERVKELKEHKSVDFAHSIAGARFRVNIFMQRRTISAVLRRIPEIIPSMEDIALPEACRDMVKLERGLVLVTGPTGSGKSTTLAAMISYINQHYAKHILTLEHPIEFVHHDKKSSVNQREVGIDALSFAGGIRDALREDPDVILVGEMRDYETIKAAIDAAETGHLVFATLHTSSAPSTIARIVGSFDGNEKAEVRSQLSQQLKAIVSQTLLPKADGNGRVGAHEVLLVSSGVKNSIANDKPSQMRSEMQTQVQRGMQTLDRSLARLVATGMVDETLAREKAQEESDFDAQLKYFRANGVGQDRRVERGDDDSGQGMTMR